MDEQLQTLIGASLSEPHTSKSLKEIPYLVVRMFNSVTDFRD